MTNIPETPETPETPGTPNAPVKERGWFIWSVCLIAFLVFMYLYYRPDIPRVITVTYTVTGANGKELFGPDAMLVSLTYQNESGGTEQRTIVTPWKLEFKAQRNAFVYISAQKRHEAGAVRTAIYVNGLLLQEAESTSEYGIATVSGSVP